MKPKLLLLERALLATFPEPQDTLGWSVVGGPETTTDRVLWLEVRDDELGVAVDPAEFVDRRLSDPRGPLELRSQGGERPPVVMLTSTQLRHYVEQSTTADGQSAGCVVTVGLSNALRVGDVADPTVVGTINLLCWTSQSLSRAAQLEALSIATEARTLAVLEHPVSSTQSGAPATGTGTDCIVVASPSVASEQANYAGKHTAVGHLLGAAVYRAVFRGVAQWLEQRRTSGV